MFNKKTSVSPVIGVILMVAITVILAAVIAVFLFNMAHGISNSKIVAVTAVKDGSVMSVHYEGGSDDAMVAYMNTTFADNGTDFHTAGNILSTTLPATKPDVGQRFTSSQFSTNFIGATHVTASCTFNDGSTQLILDTYV